MFYNGVNDGQNSYTNPMEFWRRRKTSKILDEHISRYEIAIEMAYYKSPEIVRLFLRFFWK